MSDCEPLATTYRLPKSLRLANYPQKKKIYVVCCLNPLTARTFTVFGHSLSEDRVLHKEAWVLKLLGTQLSIQVHKKVKFLNNLSLAVLKG